MFTAPLRISTVSLAFSRASVALRALAVSVGQAYGVLSKLRVSVEGTGGAPLVSSRGLESGQSRTRSSTSQLSV